VILIDNESELRGLISRLGDVFRDESRFYRLLFATGGVIALLKGMRLPYIWAATQAQIDYRSGYLRRGFFGEVCRRLHIPIWHYSVFCFVAFGLLACFFWLLVRSVQRSGLDAAGLGAFTALLASSFCITLVTNIAGYYDILMALLVLAVMQFKNPRVQVMAALAAGIVGVLVHELYAIAYLPVSLAGVVSALAGRGTAPEKTLGWAHRGNRHPVDDHSAAPGTHENDACRHCAIGGGDPRARGFSISRRCAGRNFRSFQRRESAEDVELHACGRILGIGMLRAARLLTDHPLFSCPRVADRRRATARFAVVFRTLHICAIAAESVGLRSLSVARHDGAECSALCHRRVLDA
jgi:hypothetical protein